MRLIDADPITQRLTYNNGTPTVDNYRDGAPVTLALREIKDLIQNAPTVSLWVKTTDRLPTEADAGFHGQVMTCYHDEWDCFQFLEKWDEVPVRENLYWHGLPMPPEVEE